MAIKLLYVCLGWCFIGNDGTGKTSLIVKLQTGAAEIKKGHAMEYSYIDIYDEDRDGILLPISFSMKTFLS